MEAVIFWELAAGLGGHADVQEHDSLENKSTPSASKENSTRNLIANKASAGGEIANAIGPTSTVVGDWLRKRRSLETETGNGLFLRFNKLQSRW